jgi:head-tail adaptor
VPARLWQLASTEATTGRDAAAEEWRCILEPATAIDAGDRVEYDGRLFDVHGTPDRVFGSRVVHHVEVALRFRGPVT